MSNKIQDAIMGHCVGDALGVPAEFMSREHLMVHPITEMVGAGTHRQPPGTWSDDTSLTLCLLDSLSTGLDYKDIMKKFQSWIEDDAYTARGTVFDVGIATRNAITRFTVGKPPILCGSSSEYDNGNGSLMRILPLVFYIEAKFGLENMFKKEPLSIIHRVSCLTHGHKRSQMACGFYLAIAAELIKGENIETAIRHGADNAHDAYSSMDGYCDELKHFDRIVDHNLKRVSMRYINSTAYVIDTLEAALWCLLTTRTYKDCVVNAVNLGGDSDTIAAVAGGLAGLYYGYENIPEEWLSKIAKADEIIMLCTKLYNALYMSPIE